MNLLTKILIGAGAVTGIGFLLKLKRTSAEIQTVTTAKIHRLDLSGLTVRIDVQVKNPTKGSLSIKYPFVKVIYKDATIGTSQSINQDIKIPSFGEARIDGILINIPILGLLSVGKDLYKSLKDNSGVKVNITVISTIELGLKSLPYEKTQEVILKK